MKRLLPLLIFLLICSFTQTSSARMNAYIAGSVASAAGGDNCTGSETIGWTDVEDTNATIGAGDGVVTGLYTATCTGTLDTAYLYEHADGGAEKEAKVAVFQDLSGSTGSCGATDGVPNDTCDELVAKSAQIDSTGDAGWRTAAFASGSITKGATYWIVVYTNDAWYLATGDDSGSKHSGYDATCDGYNNDPTEITYAAACALTTDTGKEISMYVTLKAP